MTRFGLTICLWGLTLSATTPSALADVTLSVTYLRQLVDHPPVLSNLDPIPADLGLAGARLALADNQTTGTFLGHHYDLTVVDVPVGGDLVAAARAALALSPFLLLDAGAPEVLAVADLPEAKAGLIFDVATPDDALRDGDCRANVLHTLPSRAMLADGLMQFLVAKRWTRLALITGPRPEDQAWAAALKASIQKFGLTLVGEKPWTFDTDLRGSATREMPLFTQEFADHDVVLVADEADDFARYVSGNSWLPRPVAGSEGFVPSAWTPALEQWGAAQLQDRFKALAGRPMAPRDYAAWTALRTLGEALSRRGTLDAADLRRYILSPDFGLDGFKGRPLSYRPWNGQLRQPIAIATPRALIDTAPFEGFLHRVNEMDTLGLDQPESTCHAFEGQ
jgi:ABC transporter substrate binding protein (PQQ-dependent alcohol dehydrogenase system)